MIAIYHNFKFILKLNNQHITKLLLRLALLSLLTLSANAASQEIGQPILIIDQYGEDVSRATFNHDSTQVLYYADQNIDGVNEFYSVPITTIKPNTPIADAAAVLLTNNESGGNLPVPIISPDHTRVVYIKINRDLALPRYELFSAPITGGSATKLNSDLELGREISDFEISPDSTRVVYRADQNTAEVFELFSVPITGGTVEPLSADLPNFSDVGFVFKISLDSTRLVYIADKTTDGIFELFSAPITGGTSVQLNGTLASNGYDATGITFFKLSPDGTRVVYMAEQNIDDVTELFSVPITGGTQVRLNGDLSSGADVHAYDISSDGSQVVYRAAQNSSANELFVVPITGGAATRLNADLPVWSSGVGRHVMSPDGTQVVYSVAQNTYNQRELYSIPITGGSAIRLKVFLTDGGNVGRFTVSPDGARVVYEADQVKDQINNNQILELFSVPITGGDGVKLSTSQTSGNGVQHARFEISSDGTQVLYLADQNEDDLNELFIVPITGGTAQRLNADLSYLDGENTNNDIRSDVDSISISPNGKFVLFEVVHNRRTPYLHETQVFLLRIDETTLNDEVCFPAGSAIICLL